MPYTPQRHYPSATFVTSCARLADLPPPAGPEVAFAGRSNAGKSSTLNRVCQRRALAHVSRTPGRTQLINFFALREGGHLVDLPGYGYAKVPEAERRRWQGLIEGYLGRREALRGLVIVMDIRHPLTAADRQLLDWCAWRGLPAHVLLNKADKLKRGRQAAALQQVRKALAEAAAPVTVQTFSASSGLGLDALYARLDEWLGEGPKKDPGQEA